MKMPDELPIEALLAELGETAAQENSDLGALFEQLGEVNRLFFELLEPPQSPALIFRDRQGVTRAQIIGERLRFGRSEACELHVPDLREVSRVHFEIAREADGFLLRDTASANGTFLRGRPGRVFCHRLLDGDVIEAAGFVFAFVDA
jgi:pSer/pThr/pTyr-binding forkhead associated (FHA) protein